MAIGPVINKLEVAARAKLALNEKKHLTECDRYSYSSAPNSLANESRYHALNSLAQDKKRADAKPLAQLALAQLLRKYETLIDGGAMTVAEVLAADSAEKQSAALTESATISRQTENRRRSSIQSGERALRSIVARVNRSVGTYDLTPEDHAAQADDMALAIARLSEGR